ncbi:MAG: hypothetical protein GY851_06265, partial [bacterium]|nr:hypothetical protein [bacterium]
SQIAGIVLASVSAYFLGYILRGMECESAPLPIVDSDSEVERAERVHRAFMSCLAATSKRCAGWDTEDIHVRACEGYSRALFGLPRGRCIEERKVAREEGRKEERAKWDPGVWRCRAWTRGAREEPHCMLIQPDARCNRFDADDDYEENARCYQGSGWERGIQEMPVGNIR